MMLVSFAPNRTKILLLLAAAASLLELGPIICLLVANENIATLLVAGLSYQIGNAASRVKPTAQYQLLFVVAALGAIAFAFTHAASALWFLGISALSWSLQVTRRQLSMETCLDLPTTVQKRTARVAGFVVAAFLPYLVWLVLVVAVLTVALTVFRKEAVVEQKATTGFGNLSERTMLEWTMLVHQIHYFAYAYAVPLLVMRSDIGGVRMIGFWFACGWISYLTAESLWRRFSPPLVFIVGHVFLSSILCLMAVTDDRPWATVVLWILSGLGGGTVYCLTLLHRQSGIMTDRIELAEDVGHVLGVVIALAGVALLKLEANDLPALGSIWAGIAALLMLIFITRRSSGAKFNLGHQGGENAD